MSQESASCASTVAKSLTFHSADESSSKLFPPNRNLSSDNKGSSSENTNKESSDDNYQVKDAHHRIQIKENAYSVDQFSPIDYPFGSNSPGYTNKNSPSRRNYQFLTSNVYGNSFSDFSDYFNKLDASNKYADGVKILNTTSIEFGNIYQGISTAPDLLAKSILTFPIRLWARRSDQPVKVFTSSKIETWEMFDDCIIILFLHLKTSKVATSYHPVTCKTNKFGEWNKDSKLVLQRSVLLTFWNSFKPTYVEYQFSRDEIKSYVQPIWDYWKVYHGEDPESHTSLKSKTDYFNYFFIINFY